MAAALMTGSESVSTPSMSKMTARIMLRILQIPASVALAARQGKRRRQVAHALPPARAASFGSFRRR
jgi:hypothetical protein